MNTNQIKCFITVAENNSFSKSATKLFLSQSTISKNISRLEKELGFKLIDRSHKHIKLTNKGSYFYQIIKPIAQKLDDTISDLRENSLSLTLGFTDTPTESKFLPKAIDQIGQLNHVSVNVEVIDPNTPTGLINLLREKYLNILCFEEDAFYNAKDIKFLPLKKMGFSVMLKRKDSLHNKKVLNFKDIRNRQIILWSSKKVLPSIKKLSFRLANENNINYTKKYDFMTIASKVKSDSKIGIIPDILADKNDPDFIYIPLNSDVTYYFGIAYNRELDNRPYFQRVLNIIKNSANAFLNDK